MTLKDSVNVAGEEYHILKNEKIANEQSQNWRLGCN